jgi:Outer membrane lipoprotein-sorting protein
MKLRNVLLTLTLALALAAGAAFALTPYEIAKKSLEIDKAPAKMTEYKMVVTNKKGRVRTYKFSAWEKQYPTGSKKLIRFAEPADSNGVGLMTWEKKGGDDLQWLFLPSRKKARQLAASDKSDQFMGSDLFYEDMGTQSADDFNHTMLQEQVMLNGKKAHLIESAPKPGVNSAYTKTRSWVEVGTFVPLKIELYGKGDKLIKTIFAQKAEQIDGFWTITHIKAQTEGQTRAKTEIFIEKREYNAEVPDRFFTKDFLVKY